MSDIYGFDPTYGYTFKQLLQIKPPREPAGFDAFWQQRYQNALKLQSVPQIKDTGKNHAGWRIFDVSYISTQQFTIRGWLLLPESGVIKRGFIIGHGYGGRDVADFNLPFKDAALLFPCFRGLSLSHHHKISTEPKWHVLHNIDTLDRYIIGGCVEDIWLGVTALLRLFPELSGHLGYLGISFGGGQLLSAAILHWTLERTVRDGGVSFPRTGETYPGFDICKLCSFLVFKKPKKGE